MNRIVVLLHWLLYFTCSSGQDGRSSQAVDRVRAKPAASAVVETSLPAPADTSRIDTSRISRLTLKEALNRFGKPIEQLAYDFPNENAAGLREGLTQYISIDSKQQVRIRQLTWKRGKHRTTVFYRYQKGDWRPLYLYSWREGMVF